VLYVYKSSARMSFLVVNDSRLDIRSAELAETGKIVCGTSSERERMHGVVICRSSTSTKVVLECSF
jgi:hypothetical protein